MTVASDSPRPAHLPSPRAAHAKSLAGLAGLALLLFYPLVLHPAQVLYSRHSDMLSMHVPKKRLLVESFAETGELPRWNPYEFCGAPLIHDLQVAAFYPPHAVLYLVGQEHVAETLSWLVLAHVILAGWLMYAYGLYEGLRPGPAFLAGVGYMLAGKFLLHLLAAGHYILVGLTWLPLATMLLDGAIRHRSLSRATAGAGAFALIILGTHPQWTFYAGLFLGIWTLGTALESAGFLGGRGPRSFGRLATSLIVWLGMGFCVAGGGAALTAVQLLPTWEFTQHTSRGESGIVEGHGGLGVLASVIKLFGPGFFHPQQTKQLIWELRGNVAIAWGMLAPLVLILGGSRRRFQFAVTALLLAFALGGSDLVQAIPGFNFFRLPSRMVIILGLPLALFAGSVTQSLLDGALADPRRKSRCLYTALSVGVVGLALAAFDGRLMLTLNPQVPLHPYWGFGLPLIFALVLLYLLARCRPDSTAWRRMWYGLLVADVLSLSFPLVAVKPEEEIYRPSEAVEYLIKQAGTARVLDRDEAKDMPETTSPLCTYQPLLHHIHTLRGYNPLDVARYQQYLDFIENKHQQREMRLGVTAFPIVNHNLLDLTGVRFLLQPSEKNFLPDEPLNADKDPRWRKVLEDERPQAYVFTGRGISRVRPYTLYERTEPLPRAFIVPRADLLDEAEPLRQLRQTDFRETLLLDVPLEPTPKADGQYQPAEIISYQPNRVEIDLPQDASGWLFLSDVWYPDWQCRVDGQPREVLRANYAFRAIRLEPGDRQVVFEYRPRSYFLGLRISQIALAVWIAVLIASGWWERRRRKTQPGD